MYTTAQHTKGSTDRLPGLLGNDVTWLLWTAANYLLDMKYSSFSLIKSLAVSLYISLPLPFSPSLSSGATTYLAKKRSRTQEQGTAMINIFSSIAWNTLCKCSCSNRKWASRTGTQHSIRKHDSKNMGLDGTLVYKTINKRLNEQANIRSEVRGQRDPLDRKSVV